jgi:amylosucrase
MPWPRTRRRHERGTIEARLFEGLRRLSSIRRGLPQLHTSTPLRVVDPDSAQVFACVRRHAQGDLVCVYNVTERPASARLPVAGDPWDHLSSTTADVVDGRVMLAAYGRLWLARPGSRLRRSSGAPVSILHT